MPSVLVSKPSIRERGNGQGWVPTNLSSRMVRPVSYLPVAGLFRRFPCLDESGLHGDAVTRPAPGVSEQQAVGRICHGDYDRGVGTWEELVAALRTTARSSRPVRCGRRPASGTTRVAAMPFIEGRCHHDQLCLARGEIEGSQIGSASAVAASPPDVAIQPAQQKVVRSSLTIEGLGNQLAVCHGDLQPGTKPETPGQRVTGQFRQCVFVAARLLEPV